MAVDVDKLEFMLEQSLFSTMRANNIDLGTGPLCSELQAILRKFLRTIARQYQPEIDRLLQQAVTRHTETDLVSWVVGEMRQLQSIAFQLFYDRICRHENLNPGQHRVNCVTAHSHAYVLSQVFQEAVAQWKAGHAVPPLSPRFVRKWRGRDWAPWLIDLLFPQDDGPDGGQGGVNRKRVA
jgi:hypothetical protein